MKNPKGSYLKNINSANLNLNIIITDGHQSPGLGSFQNCLTWTSQPLKEFSKRLWFVLQSLGANHFA
jgi:hypothetical protein